MRYTILYSITMDTLKAFGYKHMGFFFQKILEVNDSGFIYRKKNYQWPDIIRLDRFDSFFYSYIIPVPGLPCAKIYLKNGKKIILRGNILVEGGEKSTVRFFGGPTKTYEDLLQFIKRKVDISIDRF